MLECGVLPPWCVGVERGVWVSPRAWITVEFEGLLQLPSLSLLPASGPDLRALSYSVLEAVF